MAPPVYQLKAEFFKTLGHPARIRILEVLREGEHTVGEMVPKGGDPMAALARSGRTVRHAAVIANITGNPAMSVPAGTLTTPARPVARASPRPGCGCSPRGCCRRRRRNDAVSRAICMTAWVRLSPRSRSICSAPRNQPIATRRTN